MSVFGASKPLPPPRILFLDDDPARAEVFLASSPEAIWVQTAADCIAKLEESWDEVHLDHDLGGEQFVDSEREDCGMAVVRWILEAPRVHLRETRFFVHSHNQPAATIMSFQMNMSGYKVEMRPFGMPIEELEDHSRSTPHTLLGSLSRMVRRLLGRAPATEAYSYEDYQREIESLEDAPPPERPDFSWVKPSPAESEAETPPAVE